MGIDYFVNVFGKRYDDKYVTLIDGTFYNTYKRMSDDELELYDDLPKELIKHNNDTSKYTDNVYLNAILKEVAEDMVKDGKLYMDTLNGRSIYKVDKTIPDLKNVIESIENFSDGDVNVYIDVNKTYSSGRWIDINRLSNLIKDTKDKIDKYKIKVYEYEKQLNSLDYLKLTGEEKETVNTEIECTKEHVEYLEEKLDSYKELLGLYSVFIPNYRQVYIYIYSDYEDALYEDSKDIIDLFGK